jgi:hypothetical protein
MTLRPIPEEHHESIFLMQKKSFDSIHFPKFELSYILLLRYDSNHDLALPSHKIVVLTAKYYDLNSQKPFQDKKKHLL